MNTNTVVKVVLTASGAKIYNAWMWQFPLQARAPEVEAGHVLETELWQVMQIFGPHIFHGMLETPFVNNEIEILE
jgi:hypothetical protein